MGSWSTAVKALIFSSPSIPPCTPGISFAPLILRAATADNISIARVLFPEPETPQTAVIFPIGNLTVIFFKLFSLAFLTVMNSLPTGLRLIIFSKLARPDR